LVDVCLRATSRSTRLEIAVALTTRVVERARRAHALAPTSCVALGRLLTATGLVALTSKQEGTTTTQVTSTGRFRQLTVDANHDGHLRGYAKPGDVAFPMTKAERERGRPALGASTLPGHLSVVRRNARGQYAQSAVELRSGEIDLDMQHYLEHSTQVPTALAAEVRLEGDAVTLAGGVLVQAMPDGDLRRLDELREIIADGALLRLLEAHPDPQDLLRALQPDAEVVEIPVIMQWRCRCSHERVVRSLQLLEPLELAEMIEAEAPVEVSCDFCATKYSVSVDEMRGVFEILAKAKG